MGIVTLLPPSPLAKSPLPLHACQSGSIRPTILTPKHFFPPTKNRGCTNRNFSLWENFAGQVLYPLQRNSIFFFFNPSLPNHHSRSQCGAQGKEIKAGLGEEGGSGDPLTQKANLLRQGFSNLPLPPPLFLARSRIPFDGGGKGEQRKPSCDEEV